MSKSSNAVIKRINIRSEKLQQLCDITGMDSMELLEQGTFDCICEGICMNEDCDYVTQVEPDQKRGWCEICNTNTVVAATVLAGII